MRLRTATPRLPRRLASAAVVLAASAVLSAAVPAATLGNATRASSYSSQIAQLQRQNQQVIAQLQALQAQQSQAAAQAIAMQQQIAQTQTQIVAAQQQVDDINAKLATTQAQLNQVTEQLARDRRQLSELMVVMYTNGQTSAMDALVNSGSVNQFMDRFMALDSVSSRFQQLTNEVKAEQKHLDDLKVQQTQELAQATATVNGLQQLEAQQQTQEAAFQQEAAALSGQAADLTQQSQALMGRISSVQAQERAAAAAYGGNYGIINRNGALPPFAFGPKNDDFEWGQCTWYAASLRDVTWGGDAWEWYGNAIAKGMQVGMTPQAGAIVVWGAGNGYSIYGHVGYVVSAISPTSFVVDESNFFEIPGVLDQRVVPDLHDVEGFIY